LTIKESFVVNRTSVTAILNRDAQTAVVYLNTCLDLDPRQFELVNFFFHLTVPSF